MYFMISKNIDSCLGTKNYTPVSWTTPTNKSKRDFPHLALFLFFYSCTHARTCTDIVCVFFQ